MKKHDIYTTTLSLIVKQGLHNTPMSAIAKESNAAIGTIYHHFKNKEELVQALYAEIHHELEEAVIQEEIDAKNFKLEFKALMLKIFKFFIQNPDKFNFLQQYEHSPFGSDTAELESNIEYPILPDFFKFGQEKRLIKMLPLSLITNMVYTNITMLVRLQLSKKVDLNREMLELVINNCWMMIKA
jgi:AcrR family transcriptional regulator